MRGEAVMLIALLLAGCASPQGRFPDPIATPSPVDDHFDRERAVLESGNATPAPTLAVGRAWTYEGFEFYNEDAQFTVVVAKVDAEGYLFAGGAEDDLVYEALWWSPWYNKHDRDLNRADFERPRLKFPLYDGATWAYSDTLQLTARAAEVDTPVGKDSGYRIEGTNERTKVLIDYSPRAQNIVRYQSVSPEGEVFQDLRMTRIADAQGWVWYELGALTPVANPHEPAVFDVPDGYDHVLVSAGGTTGGRARVEGPAGATWSTEFSGTETWKHAMLPSAAGKWVGAVAGRPFVEDAPELPVEPPVGWAYMHVAPVRWIEGSP